MQLSLDNPKGVNAVTACGPDEIRVGPHVIRRSVILSPKQIIFDWPVSSISNLSIEDLAPALKLEPEIVLLGTGMRLAFPAGEIQAGILSRGVGFEVMDTAAACRTFNILLAEDRSVVAALIVG